MTNALARRGPDSHGLTIKRNTVLGHRRLAIFDLTSAGHQPMEVPGSGCCIVFNGAIYNFHELRQELQVLGAHFVSNTDTEVLLHGYIVWGIDELVRRCTGMYAFAIWDDNRNTLHLVRDRLGVKPLLYAEKDGALAFASTLRSLQASKLLGDVSEQAVSEFLEHGYVPEQDCILRGAQKLPPASIADWSPGKRVRIRKYWNQPAPLADSSLPFAEAVARTQSLLEAAVKRRLFADVPVGALLSGGIDSALVCWAAKKLGGSVKAFTVATPGHEADESQDAIETAKEIGIDLEVLTLSSNDDLRSTLSELSEAYAEPFAVQSALGMLRVSAAIRAAGIKVVLTGDGGDDVFLGYQRHLDLLRIQELARRTPAAFRSLARTIQPLIPAYGILRRARNAASYLGGGLRSYLLAHDGIQNFARAGLLGERLKDTLPANRSNTTLPSDPVTLLRDYLDHDLEHQFVGEYLAKVDGSTMHFGLEARSPFFDIDLWEFSAGLPYALRLHAGQPKAILRALARNCVSARVADGRKRGFRVPVESWLAGKWKNEAAQVLADSLLVRDRWIDSRALDRLVAKPNSTGVGANQLWYLLVLETWFSTFSQG